MSEEETKAAADTAPEEEAAAGEEETVKEEESNAHFEPLVSRAVIVVGCSSGAAAFWKGVEGYCISHCLYLFHTYINRSNSRK